MGIPSSNKAESLSRLPQAKDKANNHTIINQRTRMVVISYGFQRMVVSAIMEVTT
jgi:hypothetical protein